MKNLSIIKRLYLLNQYFSKEILYLYNLITHIFRMYNQKYQIFDGKKKKIFIINNLNNLASSKFLIRFIFFDIQRIVAHFYGNIFIPLQLAYWKNFFSNLYIVNLMDSNTNPKYIIWSFFKKIHYRLHTSKETTVFILKCIFLYILPLFILSFRSKISFPASIDYINYLFNNRTYSQYIDIKEKKKNKIFLYFNNFSLYNINQFSKLYIIYNNIITNYKQTILTYDTPKLLINSNQINNKFYDYDLYTIYPWIYINLNIFPFVLKSHFHIISPRNILRQYSNVNLNLFVNKNINQKIKRIHESYIYIEKKYIILKQLSLNSLIASSSNLVFPFYNQRYELKNNLQHILLNNIGSNLFISLIQYYNNSNISVKNRNLNIDTYMNRNEQITNDLKDLYFHRLFTHINNYLYIIKIYTNNLLLISNNIIYRKKKISELKKDFFINPKYGLFKRDWQLIIYSNFKNLHIKSFLFNNILITKDLLVNTLKLIEKFYYYHIYGNNKTIKTNFDNLYYQTYKTVDQKRYNYKDEIIDICQISDLSNLSSVKSLYNQKNKLLLRKKINLLHLFNDYSNSFFVIRINLLNELYNNLVYNSKIKTNNVIKNTNIYNLLQNILLIDKTNINLSNILKKKIDLYKINYVNNDHQLIVSVKETMIMQIPLLEQPNSSNDDYLIYKLHNILLRFNINILNMNLIDKNINYINKTKYNFIINNKITLNNRYENYFSIKYWLLLKKNILHNYDQWIFTWQWYKFYYKTVTTVLTVLYNDIIDNIKKAFLFKPNINIDLLSIISNKPIYKESKNVINKFKITDISKYIIAKNKFIYWSSVLNNIKIQYFYLIYIDYLILFGWIFLFYIMYLCHIYTLYGISYLCIWYNLEKNRLLKEPDWKTSLKISTLNSIVFFIQNNSLNYSFSSYIFFIYHKFYLFWIKKDFINSLVIKKNIYDIFKHKKDIILSSLINNNTLITFLEHQYSDIKERSLNQSLLYCPEEGTQYIQRYISCLHNYSFPIKKNIFNFMDLSVIGHIPLNQFAKSSMRRSMILQKNPIALSLSSISYLKILVIGNEEVCKRYIIYELLSNLNIPLINLSIDKFIYANLDIRNINIIKTIKNINLSLLIKLLTNIGPCVLWIPDFHKIIEDSILQDQNNNKYIIKKIFLSFLDQLFSNKENNNTFVIVSTTKPELVDPAFISATRLTSIIQLKTPIFFDNTQNLNNILNNTKFKLIKNKLYQDTLNPLFHYNLKDIYGFINEIKLINITDYKNMSNLEKFELAIYRQFLGITDRELSDSTQKYYILNKYNIGQVIADKVLGNITNVLLIDIYEKIWKNRFHYIFKKYYRNNLSYSTISQFSILNNILSSIAGSAGRDICLFSNYVNKEKLFFIHSQHNYDMNIVIKLLLYIINSFIVIDRYNINNIENILNGLKNDLYTLKNNKSFFSLSNNEFNRILTNNFYSFHTEIISNIRRVDFDNIYESKPQILMNNIIRTYKNYMTFENSLLVYNPYPRILMQIQEMQSKYMNSRFISNMYQKHKYAMQLHMKHTQTKIQYESLFKQNIFNQNIELLFSFKTFDIMYIIYGIRKQRDSLNSILTKKRMSFGNKKKSLNSLSKIESNIINENIYRQDINILQLISTNSAQLKQSQLCFPIYVYQSWLFNYPHNINNITFIKNKDILLNNQDITESKLQGFILECYNFMLSFLFLNKSLFINTESILQQKKKILSKNFLNEGKWTQNIDIRD